MNRQSKNTASRLNTIPQAAEKLLVGVGKVYVLLNKGEIEAIKMGSGTFILDEEIDRYIDDLPKYQVEPALQKRRKEIAA